ncbi:MAG TPA: type VI secretion system membrane subunit TssM [Burkholderiaceae bacterium]|nr:type VI secretion system membrane subunit TssM [Burkholderiaceae bacterium]
MLRTVLGLVFNRFVLVGLLLLGLLAVVWWFGPLVAIGEARPLDSDRARWITSIVLVLAVVLIFAWRAWRARRGNAQVVAQLVAAPAGGPAAESADMASVRERFQGALASLRKARFASEGDGGKSGWWQQLNARLSGRYLYQLPWYLIIGAPGSGKTTALRNAGLRFPLAAQMGDNAVRGVGGTRDCEWWFTDRAVLIDTAGRFTTQDSNQANDKATWAGFLNLLKSSRPRQPLNGVLVTASASDLLGRSGAERQRYAQTVRARLQELYEQLGVRLPVYLLVTKSDLMAGFAEHFASLDKEQRAAPWGFTFGLEPKAYEQALPVEFDALVERLNAGLIDRLQAESDPARRTRLYGFPNQLVALRAPLIELVQAAFAPSPFEADPMLRGVYLVSGTQEGTPIDRVLGAVARRYQLEQAVLPAQRASGRSFFLERLLSDVVFAEHGLAGTRRGWERRRAALVLAAYAALAVVSVGLVVAWWTSWRGNRAYVDNVATRMESVRRQVQETPNRATSDLVPLLPALQATRGLAAAQGPVSDVPWSLGFGLYQGRKLDGAAQNAYDQMLRDAVLPRLALRFEEQLRADSQPESLYEALKAYVMMYDLPHFDPNALKAQVEADWDVRLGRGLAPEQREALGEQLDSLLAQGPAVSPLPKDQALIDSTRNRLAVVSLPQRVYTRLRQGGLGEGFPEFTVIKAGGGNAPLVFTRASGEPLSKGVPGLFTYKGYYEGFQKKVDDAARQLADEQLWVLGTPVSEAKGTQAAFASDKLINDVRRLYLTDYRDTWKRFIADVRIAPVTSISQAVERTRFLAAPDTPLVPLMKAMSRETTLLAGDSALERAQRQAGSVIGDIKGKLQGAVGARTTTGAPSERIESIVDDEFVALRRMVTAPEGGKSPLDGVVARLGELQVLLTATEAALKGGGAPQPSPLPNQLKADAANSPEPVRSVLDTLGSTSAKVALMQVRETLSREVRSQVGEFCMQAAAGRYPFDQNAAREMTPADFATLFGPGGKFDQMQQKLAPYIDTSTRPWSFRAVDGTPLGADVGTLPQFQRAAAIRETYFVGGVGPATQLVFKPVEMDVALKEFTLDVDGQIVRYDHGPQIPMNVRWPGPRGTGVVRVMVQPAGSTGMVNEGPWALFRLFERVTVQPGAAPEKFRAIFDIDGRKAVFDVTAGSVRNPFRVPELRSFSCPNGL